MTFFIFILFLFKFDIFQSRKSELAQATTLDYPTRWIGNTSRRVKKNYSKIIKSMNKGQ